MAATARDVMETHVVSVSPQDPLSTVHRLFAEEDIMGAPVVDEQERVVGVISSNDLMRAAADAHDTVRGAPGDMREGLELFGPELLNAPEEYLDRLGERTVEEVMTQEPVSVAPGDGVAEIARLMRSQGIHRVLVVEDQRLVGIISTFDLIALLEKG